MEKIYSYLRNRYFVAINQFMVTILRFTTSDYLFGILDLRLLITSLVSSNFMFQRFVFSSLFSVIFFIPHTAFVFLYYEVENQKSFSDVYCQIQPMKIFRKEQKYKLSFNVFFGFLVESCKNLDFYTSCLKKKIFSNLSKLKINK